MKAIRVAICAALFTAAFPALVFGQANPVAVVSDPGARADATMALIHRLEQINRAVENVILTTQMVENQVVALEKLESGDFRGFVEAHTYQTMAINDFAALASGIELPGSDLVLDENGEPMLDEDGNVITENAEWAQVQEESQNTAALMRTSNRTLVRTDNLMENTRRRLEAGQRLRDHSRAVEGVPAHLQIVQEQMHLLSHEIQELTFVAHAAHQHFALELEQQEARERAARATRAEFYKVDEETRRIHDAEMEEDEYNAALFERGNQRRLGW